MSFLDPFGTIAMDLRGLNYA